MSLQMMKTRTKAVGNVSTNKMTQQQSLELVKTLVHGGISSVAFLRNFFADRVFDEQIYGSSDAVISYAKYANGRLGNDPANASRPCTTMRVLRRGRSKRVDSLLSSLEDVVFPALSSNALEAFQLTVHPSPDLKDRSKVLEVYTFSFRYTKEDKQLEGISLNSDESVAVNGMQPIGVSDTNHALQALLRKTMNLCGHLPDLPEERCINLNLFYVPGKEPKSEPPGFIPSPTSHLLFPEIQDWENRSDTLDKLGAGFHDTSITVNYLRNEDSTELPENLAFTYPTGLRPDLNAAKSAEVVDEDASTVIESAPATSRSPKRAKLEVKATATVPTSDTFSGFPTDGLTSETLAGDLKNGADESQTTLSSNLDVMKNGLKSMLGEEHFSAGDTQDQSFPAPPPPISQRSLLNTVQSPTQPSPSAAKGAVGRTKSVDAPSQRTPKKRAKGKEVVKCPCGHIEDEGGMIQCTVCSTLQHAPCLGYTSSDDERVPESHTCYECLLGKDVATMEKLKQLCIRRHAMAHVMKKKGCNGHTELAEELGTEPSEGKELHRYLKARGFIFNTRGSHKAGFKSTGKYLFTAVTESDDEEKWQEMLSELFNPYKHIEKYHGLPEGHESVAKPTNLAHRLLKSRSSGMMPPPETPPSRSGSVPRRRSGQSDVTTVTPTTRRGNSQTPFRTPLTKRKAAEEDTLMAPKTPGHAFSNVGRIASLTTHIPIDASGVASSPAAASVR